MLLKMIQHNFGMLTFKQMLRDHVQGHCGQADSRYYYTNKQVTLTASRVPGIMLCLCEFSLNLPNYHMR